MELWIRSQDKEKLLKVNDIAIEINMIYGYFDKNTEYELLGTYATKERALEVLDEIQDTIKLKQSWRLNKNSFKVCIQKGGYDEEQVMKIMNKMYVYEMPKE